VELEIIAIDRFEVDYPLDCAIWRMTGRRSKHSSDLSQSATQAATSTPLKRRRAFLSATCTKLCESVCLIVESR
jgi:hypothetical protein